MENNVIKIGTLGPDGSNSVAVAKEWCKNTGIDVRGLKYFDEIEDIILAVKNHAVEFGIIPIQNMRQGPVIDTLDLLGEYRMKIFDEIYLKISHRLVTRDIDIPVSEILSHPQALGQCRKNLRSHYSGIILKSTTSTSAAAKIAAKTDGVAAIASSEAAEKYGLKILDEKIQDKTKNYTRFVVISNHVSGPTGNDKTSIVVYPRQNVPGILYEILGEFANRKIDLTMAEARPDQDGDIFGQCVFHIDAIGHKNNPLLGEALALIIKKGHRVVDLGSYPVANINGEV